MRLATHTVRREDARLLTGRGHYAADFHVDGELHAYFLRSDRAHARIASIDTVSAREQPGVVAVFTGADMEALRWPPTYARFPGRGGKHVVEPKRPVIATDRVRFVGRCSTTGFRRTPASSTNSATRRRRPRFSPRPPLRTTW